MRTFLINLDRDMDRLAAVKQRLDAASVAFERVSAVYGKDLSQEKKDRAVNHLRFRMAMGRGVFDGEIGCTLSHAKIYQKMIDEKIPIACVLEDDVVAIGDMSGALKKTEQVIDVAKPQVVLLSNHGRVVRNLAPSTPNYQPSTLNLQPLASAMAAEAYVLTLPAAKALLKCLVPMKCACDMWGRWVKLGAIELYGVSPAVANQAWDVFESHIKPKEKTKRPVLTRFVSGVGKLLDRSMLMFERVGS